MTALRKTKHSLTLAVGVILLAVGLTLLTLLGLAAVAIPAVIGILTIEFKGVRRWLRSAKDFVKHSRKFSSGDRAALPIGPPKKLRRLGLWRGIQCRQET